MEGMYTEKINNLKLENERLKKEVVFHAKEAVKYERLCKVHEANDHLISNILENLKVKFVLQVEEIKQLLQKH